MFRFTFFLLLLPFLPASASAQLKLKGRITDSRNTPIELATVKLESLNRIAMSNDSGYFHMSLPGSMKKGDALVIAVSKEGYKDVVRHFAISDSLVLIIMRDNSPAKEIKPIHVARMDTGYYTDKAFTIRQADTAAPRTWEPGMLKNLFYSLSRDKSKIIRIACVKNDNEAFRFATSLHELLAMSGYTNVSDIVLIDSPQPVNGQFVSRDTSGMKVTIGHKP